MQQVLLIAVGGSIGSVARYGLSTVMYRATSETFPWGTMAVNLTGSFLIGVFMEMFDSAIIPAGWRAFLTIGFLGAYTTFSTYALETVNLLRDGEIRLAALNILANNIAGILFVVLGMYAFRLITKTIS